MNYTKDTGWYYISANNRAAAWTNAQYLNKFLLLNRKVGPFAEKRSIELLEAGDIIQLSDGYEIYHSLVVVEFQNNEPIICAHTDDALMRPISTYDANIFIGVHILGVNVG